MKTKILLEIISKFSLQRPSSKADDRIEEILKKRIASLKSIHQAPRVQKSFSYFIWKNIFSAGAVTAVIIIALHISISNEHIHEKDLLGITNAYSENLISVTNNDAEYSGLKAMDPNPVSFTLIEASCERVSLNCWEMVSN